MMMFWVIIGIIVCFIALWAEARLDDGKVEEDTPFIKKVTSVNKYAWALAIALGVIFVIPGVMKISIWMLILSLAAMAVIAIWWHGFWIDNQPIGGGDEWAELLPFMILEGIFLASASVLAGMMKISLFWPVAVAIVSAGAMLIRILQIKANDEEVSPSWWKVVAVAMIVLLVVTGFGMSPDLKGLFNGATTAAADVEDEAEPEESEEPEEPEVEEVPDGAEDILVEWTKKDSNRIDSEFARKLKAKAGDDEITPAIVKETILEDCKDPKVLAIWGYKFGLHDDPDDYEGLMEKSDGKERLSENGVRLYNKVEGYLGAVTAKREKAPEDGLNTGYDNGFVTDESYGIDGDRTGTRMTCPNGEVFWVMDRCANIVYRGGSNPNVPTGKTDNPSRPKKDNPTPTPTPNGPSGPKYNKDPNKAPKKNTEPNDDKGPGEKTIGKDKNHSTKDTKDSTSNGGKSYNEVQREVEEKKEVNQTQKTGNDSNTPSTPKPSPSTKVDNNGDKGNGGAPINKPTPKKEPETVKNDPPADHMEEPD